VHSAETAAAAGIQISRVVVVVAAAGTPACSATGAGGAAESEAAGSISLVAEAGCSLPLCASAARVGAWVGGEGGEGGGAWCRAEVASWLAATPTAGTCGRGGCSELGDCPPALPFLTAPNPLVRFGVETAGAGAAAGAAAGAGAAALWPRVREMSLAALADAGSDAASDASIPTTASTASGVSRTAWRIVDRAPALSRRLARDARFEK
jgi:hypothetical protein